MQGYDRTTAAYLPLRLSGSTNEWYVGGAQVGGVDATGANVTGVYKVAGTQVVGPRQTGWPALGGPGVYTVGAAYSQAEVTAIRNGLNTMESTMQSLVAALRTHGLLGT